MSFSSFVRAASASVSLTCWRAIVPASSNATDLAPDICTDALVKLASACCLFERSRSAAASAMRTRSSAVCSATRCSMRCRSPRSRRSRYACRSCASSSRIFACSSACCRRCAGASAAFRHVRCCSSVPPATTPRSFTHTDVAAPMPAFPRPPKHAPLPRPRPRPLPRPKSRPRPPSSTSPPPNPRTNCPASS